MNKIYTIAENLNNEYGLIKEKSITHRRFKHLNLQKLLKKFRPNKNFKFETVGKSAKGKELNLITLGKGKTNVFLWSQMHGNESTATMALLDIFNFFEDLNTQKDIKEFLLDNLKLYFLPVVNPDGLDLFQRENIYNVDINRDAKALQTPEGKILMNTFKKIRPVFSFNLHDQGIWYSAGHTKNPATISFLAPAFNEDKSLNQVRENSMKVIGGMYKVLSNYIPNCVARYSDEFEPRAFGDMFQSMGSSTILIESGGRKDDIEKQYIRKMNYISILSGLYLIADKSYKEIKLSLYDEIPYNREILFDTVLRNLKFNLSGQSFSSDIGIKMEECNTHDEASFYLKSEIGGIGDLSTFYGFSEFDMKGFDVLPAKTYKKVFHKISDIKKSDLDSLITQGFTNVIVEICDKINFVNFPLNILSTRNKDMNFKIRTKNSADFLISKNGKIHYVIINGFLTDLKNINYKNINGLVYH